MLSLVVQQNLKKNLLFILLTFTNVIACNSNSIQSVFPHFDAQKFCYPVQTEAQANRGGLSRLTFARLREVVLLVGIIYATAKQMWGTDRIAPFTSYIRFKHAKMQTGRQKHLEVEESRVCLERIVHHQINQ